MPRSVTRILVWCFLFFSIVAKSAAQADSKQIQQQLLLTEITRMDSLLFQAFNSRDLQNLKKYFTEDLEVYQDNTGVRNYEQAMESFARMFKQDYVLTREPVKRSMEVYAIKDFGAIQSGAHRFCHVENGKMDCGTFKFMHVWQKTAAGWKIKRLITYDH